jgi:hypothetical protein
MGPCLLIKILLVFWTLNEQSMSAGASGLKRQKLRVATDATYGAAGHMDIIVIL